MLMKAVITFVKNERGPSTTAQVTSGPINHLFDRIVNSALLWPSKCGFRKSSLMITFDGGSVSMISMRPMPALGFPAHSYTAPTPGRRAAVGVLHRGV